MIDWLFADPLNLLIPLFSAIIGWGTNVIAVQMMFHPVDFFGVRPFLGWQGIIPANAKALAAKSTDLITDKLINLRALFASFDAHGFSGHLDGAIEELVDQVIAETAGKYGKDKWTQLPEPVRAQIRVLLRVEVEQVTVQILADMSCVIEDIVNLKHVVVDAAHRDRKLIGDMFQTVGVEEFKFIKRSGAYFGLLFGVVQLFAWIAYPAWWVLPFFGFFVGYATNWLALKLIFEPADPIKLGPLTLHGLFHKRQQAVAKEFATMVSRDILNPENMVAKMVEGEAGVTLFGIVDRRVDELVTKFQHNPMVTAMVPADQWDSIRLELHQRLREELPKPGGFLHIFTSRAINVYSELFDRMTQLDSRSFEGVLRPAFQKDEWKLIVAGAALGLAAGVLQVVYLFGDQLRG